MTDIEISDVLDGIYAAIRNSDTETLGKLLEKRVQHGDAYQNREFVPLVMAAKPAKPGCLRILIDYGWEIDQVDSFNRSSLQYACREDNAECADILIEAGASINKYPLEQSRIPLTTSAHFGSTQCLRLLIKKGADIDACDGSGRNALCQAAEQGTLECIRVLLDNGANINSPRETMPLYYACLYDNIESAKALLEAGADTANLSPIPIEHFIAMDNTGGELTNLLAEYTKI